MKADPKRVGTDFRRGALPAPSTRAVVSAKKKQKMVNPLLRPARAHSGSLSRRGCCFDRFGNGPLPTCDLLLRTDIARNILRVLLRFAWFSQALNPGAS